MRDIQNKVVRDDIETLQRFQVFKSEAIVKVIAEEIEGITKMYVFTSTGFLYAYQISSSQANNSAKNNITLEQLSSSLINDQINEKSVFHLAN